MATFVRNRVLDKLTWEEEEERLRAERRETLCELDGLLAQLEEFNLRGREIPQRVLVQLRRRGVIFAPRATSAEIIEAVFAAQERFMRQPIGLPPLGRGNIELTGRLAS
jgi:hypothetical protein